jgi:hypothetical protein
LLSVSYEQRNGLCGRFRYIMKKEEKTKPMANQKELRLTETVTGAG